MTKFVLLAAAILLFPATLTAQPKEAPKQCRIGYTTTENELKRTARNTGAIWLEFDFKTGKGMMHALRDPKAFTSPPTERQSYPLTASMAVTPPTSTGVVKFTFNRPDDNVPVEGTMTPTPQGQHVTLVPQKKGWVAASGIGECTTG